VSVYPVGRGNLTLLGVATPDNVRKCPSTSPARALDESDVRYGGPLPGASWLEISKQGAAQTVDDMERRGLVERRPEPGDRRARRVSLTEEGSRALREARALHRDFERRLVDEVGRESVDGLVRTLEHVAGQDALRDPRLRAFYL